MRSAVWGEAPKRPARMFDSVGRLIPTRLARRMARRRNASMTAVRPKKTIIRRSSPKKADALEGDEEKEKGRRRETERRERTLLYSHAELFFTKLLCYKRNRRG